MFTQKKRARKAVTGKTGFVTAILLAAVIGVFALLVHDSLARRHDILSLPLVTTHENRTTDPQIDKVLEALERWKKRVFDAFLLLALVIGAAALLLLELGVVKRVWRIEFGKPPTHQK